jgi:hypothetical protein
MGTRDDGKALQNAGQEVTGQAEQYWKAVHAEALRMARQDRGDLFADLESEQVQRIANAVYLDRAKEVIDAAAKPSLTDMSPVPEKILARAARDAMLPAFRRWFGASKIVDAAGLPLPVYHGTNKDIDAFVPGGATKSIFFTTDAEYAAQAAGIKGWGDGDNVIAAYVRAEKPMFVAERDYSFDAIAQAKRGGFDALVTVADDGSFGRTIAVFEPGQVKSAIGNSGAFALDSASLTDEGRVVAKQAAQAALDITQSAPFKGWFGDSKVVAPDTGRPLVVYHGTGHDIHAFDTTLCGGSSENHTADFGVFFSVSPAVAGEFVPRDYGADQDTPEALGEGANLVPAYLSIRNPFVMPARDFADIIENGTGRSVRMLRKDIEAQGFDGIHIVGDASLSHEHSSELAHDTWVAFAAEQIKSAVGNSGLFDPSSASLTDRLAEPVPEPEGASMEPF